MRDSGNPTPEPSGSDLGTVAESQRTVALSDMPPATRPPRDISPKSTAPGSGPTIAAAAITDASLSTAALAALGQRYDILGDAGHGSMGNVYRARDRETGETVALKLLKPEIASDQGMMDRFKNELLFARKITHKNVCRVYEFNRVGGIAYTSMEFVEGESLRSVLNRFGALSARKGSDLALQICSGLKEAHAQGIVHRDLKPENVMIDTRGNVKIMDFGIARSMEALTRMTGAMVGTPAYMAPEQVEGKAVDYRTDIYSLGLMLYEIFTGAQAFRADNAVAVALKQMRETPALPSSIEPTIAAPVERAILKCLEKDPAKRYQSMAELESALRSPEPKNIAPSAGPMPPARVDDSVPRFATAPPVDRRKGSRAVWVAALLIVAVAAFAGIAGKNQRAVMQFLAKTPPLPRVLVPVPPASALDKPVESAPIEKTVAKESAPAEIVKPQSADVVAESGTPLAVHKNTPAEVTSTRPETPTVPADVPSTLMPAPAAADQRTPYILVGRYQRQDRAQDASKKVEDLGLPVVLVPRRNLIGGDFYVLFSGPFSPQKLQGAIEKLEIAGFSNLHAVKNWQVKPSAGVNP